MPAIAIGAGIATTPELLSYSMPAHLSPLLDRLEIKLIGLVLHENRWDSVA